MAQSKKEMMQSCLDMGAAYGELTTNRAENLTVINEEIALLNHWWEFLREDYYTPDGMVHISECLNRSDVLLRDLQND